MATVAGAVHRDGHVVIEGNRITAVGPGPARGGGERVDASGMLATPGLINCHHHLYQHATRGLAQQATLFEWLVALYPIWARVDERVERAAARAGLAALLKSGCTTASDHHYVFPGGDLLGAEVEAARELGIRFHPCRGAMDLGQSSGGLPPDSRGRGPRRDLRRLRGRADALSRSVAGFDVPDRVGAVLAVQRDPRADGRDRRLRAGTRRAVAHAYGRDGRGGGVLPGALRGAAGRVSRRSSGGSGTTCGSRTACT